MSKPSISLMPGSRVGKWSVVLIIVMPILFIMGLSFADLLYGSVIAGSSILKDITKRPALALSMLAGFASGVSGLIAGLISIIKQKDHAIMVYIATVIGALVTLYLAAELAFPH